MRCVACLQGDFHECRSEGNCGTDDGELELGNDSGIPQPVNAGSSDSGSNHPVEAVDSVHEQSGSSEKFDGFGEAPEIRTYKDDSALIDQQSTGRKRAARAYPMDAEAECEWRMKQSCGGGNFPITGCLSGKQEARHHGPDKNTLNNDLGNVHRICHFCHNRWHTLNDPNYVWAAIHEAHNPIPASLVDIALNEEFWDGRQIVKAKD